jgi:PAS domain S-box-containing protein
MNPNDFKRIRQTLERLTFIVEQLNEGVAFTDLNGTIHFANPAMARLHGSGLCRELIGKSITHLFPEDQIQTVLKSMIDTVRDRGTVQGAMTHTHRDGSTFPAQTKMVLLNDEQGRVVGLIVLVTDLSTQTQQKSLTQHIEQLELANKQLKQQIHELRQALKHDSEEPVQFDPNEYFGSPLSIRRLLATAKRHPCQRQQSGVFDGSDEPHFDEEQLHELDEIAKLLRM